MRLLLSTLAVIAALLLISVSGAMNYLFMAGLSKTPTEGYVLGGASVAVDIFKALLPIFMWWAWRDRRFGFLVPASIMFLLFSAFSLTSAIGFAASNRGHVSEIKEGANATLKDIRADIKTDAAKIASLPRHRPARTIEQAIKAQRQNRRWQATKGCADGQATASASRTFCTKYFTLRAELETAISADRIQARITANKLAEKRLTDRGAGGDTDPQVSILAKLSGNDQSTVRTALILFVALLLELGSGLGLWIATGHSEIFRRSKSEARAQPQMASAEPLEDAVSRETTPTLTPALSARPEPVRRTPARTIPHTLEKEPEQPDNDRQELVTEIQDYLLERLRPASDGGLSLSELFSDYQQWSEAKEISPAGQGFFGRVIEKQMEQVGIESDGQHYVGIKLAPALTVPGAKRSTA